MQETLSLLTHHPLLQGLTPAQLDRFMTHLVEIEATMGMTIIREGDPSDRFFILLEGEVEISERMTLKISRHSFEERDRTLVRLSADMGIFFGEMALFEDTPRTANVIALTDCRLLSIDLKSFEAFAQKEPHAAYLLLRSIAKAFSTRIQQMNLDIKKLTTALSIALQ